MNSAEAAAQAAIRAAFGAAVRYTGAGLTDASIVAIKSDREADPFQGAGSTLREISFEVLQADLPERPRKGNGIVEDDGEGPAWQVLEARRRDDIASWQLIVEEAETP